MVVRRIVRMQHKERYKAQAAAVQKGEELNMKNYFKINPYREFVFSPQLEKWFEEVENALGFKLFFWQKTYIERGVFRCYGETTARILRELSQVNERPINLIGYRARNIRESFYYDELLKMKRTLDEAGVPTREVWTCEKDRRKHIERNLTKCNGEN